MEQKHYYRGFTKGYSRKIIVPYQPCRFEKNTKIGTKNNSKNKPKRIKIIFKDKKTSLKDELKSIQKENKEIKICTKCGQPKTIGNFSISLKSKGGFSAQCKACAKHYRENRHKEIKKIVEEMYNTTQ